MDTTPAGQAILKTDTLGRVQTPKERREQLLDEFEKSGLTGQKFAAVSGVKYQTFATWAQKRRRGREKSVSKAPVEVGDPVHWLEAVVEESTRDKRPLVLELPGGARMEIADGRQAALAAMLLRRTDRACLHFQSTLSKSLNIPIKSHFSLRFLFAPPMSKKSVSLPCLDHNSPPTHHAPRKPFAFFPAFARNPSDHPTCRAKAPSEGGCLVVAPL